MNVKTKASTKKERMNIWLVVFCIIAVVAVLSWIIPSGAFQYETIDVNGTQRSVAIAGTYERIDKSEAMPTGFLGLFAALYSGMVSARYNLCYPHLRCHLRRYGKDRCLPRRHRQDNAEAGPP